MSKLPWEEEGFFTKTARKKVSNRELQNVVDILVDTDKQLPTVTRTALGVGLHEVSSNFFKRLHRLIREDENGVWRLQGPDNHGCESDMETELHACDISWHVCYDCGGPYAEGEECPCED
jgi:hypothetical protein